jgi:glycosyltransferase involved in cell wall biosynthesis
VPQIEYSITETREPERALKILILCYEWPPVGGGGGRAAKEVAEAIAARGHQVRVQTIRFNETPAHEFANGVDTYRTWGFRHRADQCTPLEMAGYVTSSAIPALGHIAEFKPDLIHAHFAVPTGVLALACSRLSGRPYVITAHLGDVPGAIPEQTDALFRWLNPLIRPIWRLAANVVAVSKFVGELAENAYGRKPVIIPNGVRLSRRPGVPQATSRAPRLIFVGRLNPQKNLLFLPPVLAKIRELEWEVDIVGDGADRRALETAFAEFALSSRIHFHGWLDRAAVEQKLIEAEIFILPSLVEGLSLAALEALKFGLLLIGSDIPTLRDCVAQNVNGYLIPLHSPELWIKHLTTILTDPKLRLSMRQKSWEMAPEFDLERITDQYEELYREVRRQTAEGRIKN